MSTEKINFEALCDVFDTLRSSANLAVLGGSLSKDNTPSFGAKVSNNALIAPAVTEGAYALAISLLLAVHFCKNNYTCDYSTTFRLITAIFSAAASALIFTDLVTSGNAFPTDLSTAGIGLAAFSIFSSKAASTYVHRKNALSAEQGASGTNMTAFDASYSRV